MSITLVVCVLYESYNPKTSSCSSQYNVSHISTTVKSILNGTLMPSDIVIADSQYLPLSLKKKDRVSVIKSENYGMLSSLVAGIKKHGTSSNIKYIVVDAKVAYLPHLAREYLSCATEDFKDSVFGLSGIVFIENKEENFANALKSLLSDESVNLKSREAAYTKDNCTVDILEICGSIYFNGTQISDFVNADQTVLKEYNSVQAAVHLSNYFSKKGIYKTQICNLVNNKYIMEKLNCFFNINIKFNDYLTELTHLTDLNELHIFKV
jgi:hypothetical protein